jgi:hypothetical protein
MRGITTTISEQERIMEEKKAKPKVECQFCRAEVSRGFLRSHQRRPGCVAARNTLVMERRGWRVIGEEELVVMAKAAGVGPESHETDHGPENYGSRSGKKSMLKRQNWVPAWFAQIFGTAGTWKLREHNGTSISMEEVRTLYVPLMAEAAKSKEQQEALLAMHALSGIDGVKTLVFTSQMRASKLRKEAEELREKAREKEMAAEALDPTRYEVADAG